jgi:hypothetical protein
MTLTVADWDMRYHDAFLVETHPGFVWPSGDGPWVDFGGFLMRFSAFWANFGLEMVFFWPEMALFWPRK